MGAVVKLPDPMDELYKARTVRMDAPALALSRALDRMQHSTNENDIARCRLIRREMARRALAADHADATSQEQAREPAKIIYGHDDRFQRIETDADRDAETVANIAVSVVVVAALLGLAFLVGNFAKWMEWI